MLQIQVLNEKNINVCLFIFFQLKTIFINKNKSNNSVKNPAHPERSRSEFEAFSYSWFGSDGKHQMNIPLFYYDFNLDVELLVYVHC